MKNETRLKQHTCIDVRSQLLKCLLEVEGDRLYWLNITIKDRPCAEGSRDHSCARAFCFNKQSMKSAYLLSLFWEVCITCQRMMMKWYSCQARFRLLRAVSNDVSFVWHFPPPFFHKPWLTESSGAHQQSQTMGKCLLFPFSFFFI
jgi:hypothetical protein